MGIVIGVLLGLLAIAVIAAAISRANLVEFKPVHANSENEYQTVDQYPDHFATQLRQVLKYYNVPHQLDRDRIFIDNTVYDDKELMFNYTKKALDETWLQQHSK
ncbi:MAG: hypothetical protein AB8E82_09065 [Aureispira sp.]